MLDLLDWTDAISVGVEGIDEQHRKLIDLINDVFEAIATGSDVEFYNSVIERLQDYVSIHFEFEEALMQKHGYPDWQKHRQEHRALVEETFRLQLRVDIGTTLGLPTEVMAFLNRWLITHIQRSDFRFGQFLNEKGVF